MMVDKGHQVTWWTSTFDHQSKSYIVDRDKTVSVKGGVEMIYLHSNIGYKKNVSIRRLLNHRFVAKKFEIISDTKSAPDLIYCSFPTIELSYAAVDYAKRNHIPIVVDTRDLWPDIFINPFPKLLHPFIKLILNGYFKQTKYIFKKADGITAVSLNYLNWSLIYGQRKRSLNDEVFPLAYNKYTDINKNYILRDFVKLGVRPTKTIIWFVGTFGQTYDLKTIIQGARILEKHNTENIQFVFTGDGDNMRNWKKLAKGLQNVVFTGWANRHELNYLSSIADIGLMSYSIGAPQGLPNKIFEYMSSGVPILSSLRGETKDFLELNRIGLSYEPGSVESFLKKLKTLLKDEALRSDFGKSGKTLLENQFTSEIVYNNLIKYLENI